MPNIRIAARDETDGLLDLSDPATIDALRTARSLESHHNANVAYGQSVLPSGIRSRIIDNSNGLAMHVLEAGFSGEARPCVLLLHGFPELALSWRYVMPTLAAAGYYVVAPDQRGYGRTTGWDGSYDGDLASFRLTNPGPGILSGWSRLSGIAPSPPLSDMISAHPSLRGVRFSGRTYFAPLC